MITTLTETSNLTSLFLTLSAIIITLLIWYIKLSKKLNQYSSPLPPGPLGFPVVGSLLTLKPDLHSYFKSLAHTYGPILKLRLGSKLKIIITSPTLAHQVLKENDIVFANRDVLSITRSSVYGITNIVWTPYGPEWRMLRKVCVLKMLSNASLDAVCSDRRRVVRQGVNQLYNRVVLDQSPVEVGEHVFFTVLNLIMNMLWGGTVDVEEGASVGAEIREIINGISELMSKPNVSDFFPVLAWFDLQGISKKNRQLIQSFDRIVNRMISTRMKIEEDGGNGNNDFLQFLLRLKDEEDSKTPLTLTHVKSLLLDMVAGGTDTSTNTIEFAMAEIITHQT
ncbi:hypothetical protein F8388_001908 [Cannabis sativa]|uniref:Cytochrome P450 n=1 Tax=Cannabis sativa TaxID=3483 RepID=A0A7J6EPS6_CANSA|nr:hypothetical protein F8388_001908 [Cannabis sativa]